MATWLAVTTEAHIAISFNNNWRIILLEGNPWARAEDIESYATVIAAAEPQVDFRILEF